ncbi:MAG: CHAT domain-containing tetratricopeptide repeat protein [Bacteroidota bacterium]
MPAHPFSFLRSMKFLFLLWILWVLPLPNLLSQSQQTDKGSLLREKALSLLNERPDSSLYYVKLACEFYLSREDTLSLIDCRYDLMAPYYLMGQGNAMDSIIALNWDWAQKYLSPHNPEEAPLYGYAALAQGYSLTRSNQILESISLNEQGFEVLENLDSIPANYLPNIAESYTITGIGLSEIGDYEEAIKYHRKSLQTYKQNPSMDPIEIVAAYYNIGTDWNFRFQLDSAKAYFQIAEKYLAKIPKEHPEYKWFQEYMNKGKTTLFVNQPDSMILYAKKAIGYLSSRSSSGDSSLAYTRMGLALSKKGRFEDAKKNLLTGLRLSRSARLVQDIYPEHYALFTLGNLYTDQGNFPKAQEYYDMALALHLGSSRNENLMATEVVEKYEALRIISKKMSCYTLQENISLQNAIYYSNLAKKLIFELRKSFVAEGSKLDLAKLSHDIFESSITLFNQHSTPSLTDSLLHHAFSSIEASKYILLHEALLHKEAQLGLPLELRKQERVYKRNIAYFEKRLYDASKQKDPNVEKVENLREALFLLQQNHKRFTDSLERLYPAYYKQKYAVKQTEWRDIQRILTPSQAFLQYFVGDSSIFVMGIHREKVVFRQIPLTVSLTETLTGYLASLSHPQALESTESGDRYVKQARALYQEILEPILLKLPETIHQLIISPDGMLSYVPFEALLDAKVEAPWRYSELPYLLHSYAISYTHSATNWMEQKEKIAEKVSNNWLGFAPSYEEAQIKESVQPLAIDRFLTRDGSVQLPHAQEEISQISALTKGDGFFQQTALESDFHTLAPNYKILHLATHGLVEDQDPMYSKLVFAPQSDSGYDGFLHAYEIYNMQLPADLVVLSACNTGIGKLEKGEGIMSLSRAFFYAGVKSLVLSLWSVADESTSEVMVNFYKELKEGKTKDMALQSAKLKYLENQGVALKSHPYFWAGFVLKGNSEAISLKSSSYRYFWLIGLLLLGIGIGLLWKQLANRKA